MTNAIETTKRGMYAYLSAMKEADYGINPYLPVFEAQLEAHLEALRQELTYQPDTASQMRQERDDCQSRLQAVDHAYSAQQLANTAAGNELRAALSEVNRLREVLHHRTNERGLAENVAKVMTKQRNEARERLEETRQAKASTSAQDSKEKGASEAVDT
jgi:chromosome segregation ATPase